MHNTLPVEIRETISLVGVHQKVSHSITWGQFTQLTYPGECRWEVTGGADWPIPAAELVSVTATRNGLEIVGVDAVEAAYKNLGDQLDQHSSDPNLLNQYDALKSVLVVLEVAEKMQPAKAE